MTVTTRDRQEQALDAIALFAHRSLVGLVREGLAPEEPYVGSGTLLRIGDRPVILTALHLLEEDRDRERMGLIYIDVRRLKPEVSEARLFLRDGPGKPFRPGVITHQGATIRLVLHACLSAIHTAPDGLDVALVEVKPEHEKGLLNLDPLAIDDAVATADGADVRDEQLCLLGMPSDLLRLDCERAEIEFKTFVHYAVLRPGCSAEKHPARGVHVDWTEAAERGQHPRGMSGGPLLRLRGLPTTEVWSAAGAAKIVGIASHAYPGHGDTPYCERCESVADFGSWLREKGAEIASRPG